MDHTQKHRLTRAEILLVFVLVVAFATTAWAEVTPIRNSPKLTQLSLTQAVALAAQPHGMRAETQKLHFRFFKRKWGDRRTARHRRRQHALATRAQAAQPVATGSGRPDWYAIAQCESGGRWNLNTSNGYWGGLQFAPSTWFAYGGGSFSGQGPFPYSASQQIAVAERVYAGQGPDAWPVCFRWA
jgi:Transglycosylase-like domain